MTGLLIGMCLRVSYAGLAYDGPARWAADPVVGLVFARKLHKPLLVVCSTRGGVSDTSVSALRDQDNALRASRYMRFMVSSKEQLALIDPDRPFPSYTSILAYNADGKFLGGISGMSYTAAVSGFLDRCLRIDRLLAREEGVVPDPDALRALQGADNVSGITANLIATDHRRLLGEFEASLKFARVAWELAKTPDERFEASARLVNGYIRTNQRAEALKIAKVMTSDLTQPNYRRAVFPRIVGGGPKGRPSTFGAAPTS